jgi:hypothetical protein
MKNGKNQRKINMSIFDCFRYKAKEPMAYREIDWEKVTTVEDLTKILGGCRLFRKIKVYEDYWDEYGHMLGKDIHLDED